MLTAYRDVFLYRELSKKLNIHTSMLCRYAQGLAVPSEHNTRKIINTLLSKEVVKEFLYRYLSKCGWDLSKALSHPKVLNILNLYISDRILSSLVGSGLKVLISLSETSALITSLVAVRLGLPIFLIPHNEVRSSAEVSDMISKSSLRRGDYVAVITSMLTNENLNIVDEFISGHGLILKCLMSVILVDRNLEKDVGNLTLFDYLIP